MCDWCIAKRKIESIMRGYDLRCKGLDKALYYWDCEDSEEEECGFFHPNQWNLPGYYDEQGNSNIEAAMESEKVHRKFLLSKGATSANIQKRMQERPN